jgi:hypothetical protein
MPGDNPFEYHAPDDDQVERIRRVRTALGIAYETLLKDVPPGAERTLAVRKLEEASMWANKAVVFPGGYEK